MDKYLGTVLDGRYEILEIIGTGGMAMVYKARDNRLNRLVAIKILKDDLALDADFRRRFQTESQAVAMLSSPNIVAVYDVSKSLEVEYIVMELVEGITLKQYMNRKGKLNWKESLHFATQITKALSHAHSRGIIHRDIKPHNIMILKDGSVKVADFGIARLQDGKSSTLTQEALGSVHYISPEQAKGAQVDARSDLYSVGVVLYEMLTSRLPFEGDSAVSVAIQHISSIPLSPREINSEIPVGLEAITMRAMNPSLNLRYQTADEMLRDFEEFRKNPNIVFPYVSAAATASAAGAVAGAATDPWSAATPGGNSVPPRRPSADDRYGSQPPRDPKDDRSRPRKGERPPRDDEREKYRTQNQKAKRVSTLLGIGVILVVLVAIFWVLWTMIIQPLFAPAQRVEVDNFFNLHIESVMNDPDFRERYNFTTVYEATNAHPEGFVIRQSPLAGRPVNVDADGRVRVTLTVATAPDQPEMPDLFNLTFEEAQMRLTGMGIPMANIHRRDEASDEIMENRVIHTIPERQRPLFDGMDVFIFVSIGPEEREVRVPNLQGRALSVAIMELQGIGLDYNTIMEYSNETLGTVIDQDIAPNTMVPERTRITLTISQGPEPTPTPTPTPEPTPTPTPEPTPSPTPTSIPEGPIQTPNGSEENS